MGRNKEHLRKLLELIQVIYNESDTEFVAGVQNMVLSDKVFYERLFSKDNDLNPELLKKIEQYLSLDYRIDSKILPDYSFVDNENVREKLIADYREMLRYEFGTRNHKIDFGEFCRYGALQIELLVNYYCCTKYNNDIKSIIEAIKETSPDYKPYERLKEVSEIPLKTKLYHIKTVFNWNITDYYHCRYIIDVRNQLSHRSLSDIKDIIKEVEDALKKVGAWNVKRDSFDFNKKAIAEEKIGKDILDNYQFQVWYDKQPFDEVLSLIKQLVDSINKAIN